MGTHPIFESDFDCLTEPTKSHVCPMMRAVRPMHFRALSVSPKSFALVSDEIFKQMESKVNADNVKKIKGIFEINVTENKKVVKTWTADLKNGDGSLAEGVGEAKPDIVITVSDADLVKMATGKLNPQNAFFSGKMKIKGDIMKSQKLNILLK